MLKHLWKILFPTCTKREQRTVRYAFHTVLLSALIMSLASVMSQDVSYVTVKAVPAEVSQGDQFYIDITATAHTPVNAVDITLEYPESQMKIDAIDTGTSVITLWTEEPYARDGSIYLSGGTFRRGFLGEHTIARVRATALQTGTAFVTTDTAQFVAGDGLGTNVPVTSGTDEARIYITASEDGVLTGEAKVSIVTDIDGDGEVSLKDISAFMAAWLTRANTFDFNGDGRMTFKDFSILLSDSFSK